MGKKYQRREGVLQRRGTLKRQIRDTERLLSREGLPETVRQTKERVLKSLKKELSKQATDKKNKKLSKQYKMVKFFEKTKVLRKLKGAVQERTNSTDESERAGLEEVIARLRMELNYVVHFPVGSKYFSLYPSTSTTSEECIARRDALLAKISERVANGDLLDASKTIVGDVKIASTDSRHLMERVVGVIQSAELSPTRPARQSTQDNKDSESGSEIQSDSDSRTIRDDFFLDVSGNFDQVL